MNGPNAESLKAALDPHQIEREIADLDETIKGLDPLDTMQKPAKNAVFENPKSGPGEAPEPDEYAWINGERIAGEPDHRTPFWDHGATEEDWLRNQLSACRHAVKWLRAETTAAREALRGIEQHSEEVKAIKAELVSTLKELVPLAKRNAKRGSPALLRLITRAVRTKL